MVTYHANLVLFVCSRNQFRSQMAEGFFNYYSLSDGFNPHVANSAGVHVNHPHTVPSSTVELMRERGVDISGQHVKLLTPELAARAYRIYDLAGFVKPEHLGIPPAKVLLTLVKDTVWAHLDKQRATRDSIEQIVLSILEDLKVRPPGLAR